MPATAATTPAPSAPDGLPEKDLVLDVALRLGKLLESRMGAEVVYTRDDDTFVPLETRTAIANKQQADLFISIHANSSHDPSARGVETYYLNFNLVARCAGSGRPRKRRLREVHSRTRRPGEEDRAEGEDRGIARVRRRRAALALPGPAGKDKALRNRGVKKAPFIVLIGANMPSILAEISFVSNPGDERKLETPEYRQKIAEALYRGVAKYVSGLSGLKMATKMPKDAGQ